MLLLDRGKPRRSRDSRTMKLQAPAVLPWSVLLRGPLFQLFHRTQCQILLHVCQKDSDTQGQGQGWQPRVIKWDVLCETERVITANLQR